MKNILALLFWTYGNAKKCDSMATWCFTYVLITNIDHSANAVWYFSPLDTWSKLPMNMDLEIFSYYMELGWDTLRRIQMENLRLILSKKQWEHCSKLIRTENSFRLKFFFISFMKINYCIPKFIIKFFEVIYGVSKTDQTENSFKQVVLLNFKRNRFLRINTYFIKYLHNYYFPRLLPFKFMKV